MQMKDILMDRKEYSEEKAIEWVEKHKDDTVYQLLVLKKELTTVEKDCRPVGVNSSIWHEEEDY